MDGVGLILGKEVKPGFLQAGTSALLVQSQYAASLRVDEPRLDTEAVFTGIEKAQQPIQIVEDSGIFPCMFFGIKLGGAIPGICRHELPH